MAQTYTLFTGQKVQARPGQYVRCDCFGRFLRTEDSIHNGLGLTFRAQRDGTLARVIY